ncbi:SLIP GTPase, partial [Nothocercus nigrocapillus]|nr:SLIP GTPase [Nothocercus nigrocapillus]
RDRLATLKEKSTFSVTSIGLFGSTGAGKSTLLNTLLGQEFFLPVSGTQTCTSCQVRVSVCRSKHYEANIFLLSEKEWKEELKHLLAFLEEHDDDEEGESNKDVELAISKLRTVYGEGAERRSYEELLRATPKVNIPSTRHITLRKPKAEELSEELDPYIRNQGNDEEDQMEDGSSNMRERTQKMQLWPLIKHVEVILPMSNLIPEGVVFVDIPGTGDSNKDRDEMWKKSILECSSIWIIAGVERVLGAKTQEIMLREAIKACQAGNCSDITFVVTKTDNLSVEEYLSKHDAILEQNKNLKNSKDKSIRLRMQKNLHSSAEVLQKPNLVYTVSAREYWKSDTTKTLNKEETEISMLQDHVRKLRLNMMKNQLRNYMHEIHVVFCLLDVCRYMHVERPFPLDSLDEYVKLKIQGLGTAAGHIFDQINLHLNNGVESARKLYKKKMEKLFNQGQNSRGFHRTLKALCMRKGELVSRVFERLDLNDALAQPVYEHIDAPFEIIFRKQQPMKESLQLAMDNFSTEIKDKFKSFGESIKLENSRLNFLLQETDNIMKGLEGKILRNKKSIYESYVLEIKSSLSPYYDEAARIRGRQASQKIIKRLYEAVEEKVANNMFEGARNRMKSQFQEL